MDEHGLAQTDTEEVVQKFELPERYHDGETQSFDFTGGAQHLWSEEEIAKYKADLREQINKAIFDALVRKEIYLPMTRQEFRKIVKDRGFAGAVSGLELRGEGGLPIAHYVDGWQLIFEADEEST